MAKSEPKYSDKRNALINVLSESQIPFSLGMDDEELVSLVKANGLDVNAKPAAEKAEKKAKVKAKKKVSKK